MTVAAPDLVPTLPTHEVASADAVGLEAVAAGVVWLGPAAFCATDGGPATTAELVLPEGLAARTLVKLRVRRDEAAAPDLAARMERMRVGNRDAEGTAPAADGGEAEATARVVTLPASPPAAAPPPGRGVSLVTVRAPAGLPRASPFQSRTLELVLLVDRSGSTVYTPAPGEGAGSNADVAAAGTRPPSSARSPGRSAGSRRAATWARSSSST